MTGSFVLHEALLLLQEESTEDYDIPNEVVIQGRSDQELTHYLNDITDRIGLSAENIVDPLVFDKIRSFLKNFQFVSRRISLRLIDIILSAFKSEIKAAADDLANNAKEALSQHRMYLEHYGFLIHWMLLTIQDKISTTTKSKKGKGRDDDNSGEWYTQKEAAFDSIGKLLELNLSKIWTLTPERGTFITLFTKPAYAVFEHPITAKSVNVKNLAFKVLALSIKYYGQMFAAQTTIIQNLQYWEHSSETMAELLHCLISQYDYKQLADEVLREISNKEFKDTTVKEVKDSPNAKTFASFLVKLTELSPKTILKNLGLLVHQLDSESYAMRIAITDILCLLIEYLSNHMDDNPSHQEQINGFFDILEERMLDSSAFVRSKVLQGYIKILELRAKFPKRRHAVAILAIRHFKDKSSLVRKYAVRVLTKLISTHPFSMYGGELRLADWEKKLQAIEAELKNVEAPSDMPDMMSMTISQNLESTEEAERQEPKVDEDVEMEEVGDAESGGEAEEEAKDPATKNSSDDGEESSIAAEKEQTPENDQPEQEPQQPKTMISVEKMQQLTLMRTFHKDAVRFIKLVHSAMPTICDLLSSKSKPEVLEAMDCLVVAYNYKIKAADEGIKKMLHLIWTKDTSDEGKGVKMKLLQCYKDLYFDFDANLSKRENINNVTRNLIQLTFNTTLAELTSLEQLLCTVMQEQELPHTVIEKLWAVYGFRGNIPKSQRRGAIIILGMLARAETEIVSEKVDLLLKIGLGPLGKADLGLARYTCVALQRLAGQRSPEKGRSAHAGIRFPMNHAIFSRLKDLIENLDSSTEWFSVTEQAINTIYMLGEHPDILCSEIIKNKTMKVFGEQPKDNPSQADIELPSEAMDVDYDMSMSQQALPQPLNPQLQDAAELSQLLFIVGHVALKQIVHLEIIEAAWKKKRAKKDAEDAGNKNKAAVDELEQVGGTAEDDIGDTITHIREREVLFGQNSLLARFGPIVNYICLRNKVYTDRTLQISATLALAKFMCVSSDFCEKHLRLLFTILEHSKDATIRSNIVIALGDMAVCFSTLIDDNITFLYNRLSDPDSQVKKNAVMVLTHLILNGMVKVKGQISEMAKCLEDKDQRIADLAKLFFTELATKDNAIYNNLPDIISNLTNCEPKLEEESFRRIMKFIFSFDFTEKEKQAENVIDKLCHRLGNTDDQRIWRDIAYCLSQLPFKSERSFRRLLECMPLYQDKLHEESVHKSFTDILAKGRLQKVQKPELKAFLDDLEQKMNKQVGEIQDDETETPAKRPVVKATGSRRKATRRLTRRA